MRAYCLLVVDKYAFILYRERSILWIFMLIQSILFMLTYFYPEVQIYTFTFYREMSNECFFTLIRLILCLQAYFLTAVESYTITPRAL